MPAPRESVIDKVAKLLRKAEDPAATTEEAETYFAKAQQLMAQHAIEQVELQRAGGEQVREEIILLPFTDAIAIRDEVKMAKQWIAKGVAESVRCRYLWIESGRTERHIFVGYKSDAEFAALLFQSVLMQMAVERGKALRLRDAHVSRYIFVRSFAEAYGARIYHRLMASGEAAAKSTGKELVLRDRAQDVEQYIDDLLAGSKTREKKPTTRSVDGTAAIAGESAAGRADLSGGRNAVKRGGKQVSIGGA